MLASFVAWVQEPPSTTNVRISTPIRMVRCYPRRKRFASFELSWKAKNLK